MTLQEAIIDEGSAINSLRKLNAQFGKWYAIWNETRPAQGPAREAMDDSKLNAGALVSRHEMNRLRPLITAQETKLREARDTIARARSNGR
jgi:hypothetical protein